MKVRFNICNVMYAIPNAQGSYEEVTPKRLGGVHQLTLESNYSEQKIYADGSVAFVIPSDQGLTGTLTLTAIDEQYEIDMGWKMKIHGATAEPQQLASKEHAIYFEIHEMSQGSKSRVLLKCWLYGVISSKPAKTFTQDQEESTINNIEIPINILGTYLKDASGQNLYRDENGNAIKIWWAISSPEDEGYSTFGNTVYLPKALATQS